MANDQAFDRDAVTITRKATMPVTRANLDFAATLQGMSEDDFLQAWHAAVTADDEQRIALIESAATRRFGLSAWHHRYAMRFPEQARYRLPTKRW